MNNTTLEGLWTKLDPKTQEWLRAHPGSVILPRSVTGALLRAGDRRDSLKGIDRHGQFLLSPPDRTFLKSMAASSPVDHPVRPGSP
jgi:hypothetical protein